MLEHDGEEAPQQFSEDGDFVIGNMEGKGIGNYSCSYRLQAYPDIWSEPSDSLELVGAAGEWVMLPGTFLFSCYWDLKNSLHRDKAK